MSITPDHHPKDCRCGGTGRVSFEGGRVTDIFQQRPCGEFWVDPREPVDLTFSIEKASEMARDGAWRSVAKYPTTKAMFVSMLQEAGELATVLRRGDKQHTYREALDVAALAIRIAVQGDDDGAHAFDPLREIAERDKQLDDLHKLLRDARAVLPTAYTDGTHVWRRESVPLDENDCPMPTCPGCGAYHELVRPGKTQPTCLCDAYQHEVDRHRETKELVEALRAELKRLQGVEVKPTDRLCSVVDNGQTLYELLGSGTVYYHSGMSRDQLCTLIQHVSKAFHNEIMFRAKKS